MVNMAVNPSIQLKKQKTECNQCLPTLTEMYLESSLVSPRVISSKTPDHQGYYNRRSDGNATLLPPLQCMCFCKNKHKSSESKRTDNAVRGAVAGGNVERNAG